MTPSLERQQDVNLEYRHVLWLYTHIITWVSNHLENCSENLCVVLGTSKGAEQVQRLCQPLEMRHDTSLIFL